MTSFIGMPTPRVDGFAKVTGSAKYAGEFNVRDLAHGCVVVSAIAKGRIAAVDTSRALRVAGVLDVLTHRNRPRMAQDDEAYKDAIAPEGSPFRPLYNGTILFSGQPIALVLAEALEIARFAASLVTVEYEEKAPSTDLNRERSHAFALAGDAFAMSLAKPRGDFVSAYAASPVRHEAEYRVPIEHHNPMELFASTAIWEGAGRLTVYDKTQGVQNVQGYLCGIFGMQPSEVRVMSPFVGGAFGSGLRPQYQVALAAMGALALKRSVRLTLTRRQMYGLCYRPESIERVALGASASGTLNAVTQEALANTSQYETFARNDTTWAEALYKCSNAKYAHKLARLDLPTPADMRAPGAATGVFALECAMDELAEALNLDPVELRLRNYSDREQKEDLPYSSKQLRECYRRGAGAFGWARRNSSPRSTRDNGELIGFGMASGVWDAMQMPFTVRISLSPNAHAEVSCATSDIGTGTYTIMTQVAAELLGLPLDNVSIKLGDFSLPQSPVEGGSWTAASVSNAIAASADEVLGALLASALRANNSPLAGAKPGDVILRDGMLLSRKDPSRSVSISDAMRHGGTGKIEREASNDPNRDAGHAHNTHSAVFAEVRVDEELSVIRATRLLGAVAAGRILNPKTARSQILGGMVWGLGMALHEETLIDHTLGRFVNADLAEYHVPVNADVRDIDVIFVEEADEFINPLGIKGVGEIGIVGVAAAIANAVYNATGKRVRDLPITLDKLQG